MRHHHRVAFLVTVIATTAALLVPLSASADELEVQDGRGDYWHDHRAEGFDPDQHRPDWGNPDLRRTVYRHWHDRVSVRFKMARLVRGDGGYRQVEIRMRTNEGLHRTATWFKAHDGHPFVEWSGPGSCAIKGRIDFAADAFIVDIPRSCLSNPRRVAFKSATRWWPTSDDVAYLDVSGDDGYRLSDWSMPVKKG